MRIDRTARRVLSALVVAGSTAVLVAGPEPTAGDAEARRVAAAAVQRPVDVPVPGPAVAAAGGAADTSAAQVQAAVAAAVAPLAAGLPAGSVSVAGLDTTSGARAGWGADSGMVTASVAKLLLLEADLLQDQDRGQPPGSGNGGALAAMIENSDNDAADQVYGALGGEDQLVPALARLGLSATVPGPADQWGLSTSSAGDQLTALTDLVSTPSPLSSASQAYALDLLRDVEPDQRWGVGAAADPAGDFANKDGWLDVDDDGGRWVTSSVGVVPVGGHQLLLAVLTQHDLDLQGGMDLVESLSRAVAEAVRAAVPSVPPTGSAGGAALPRMLQ